MWTKTPPTEPGFYWTTFGRRANGIRELFYHEGVLYASTYDVDVSGEEIRRIPPAELGYWWWPVPIEPPDQITPGPAWTRNTNTPDQEPA